MRVFDDFSRPAVAAPAPPEMDAQPVTEQASSSAVEPLSSSTDAQQQPSSALPKPTRKKKRKKTVSRKRSKQAPAVPIEVLAPNFDLPHRENDNSGEVDESYVAVLF